jgi:hypothetical protein
MAAANAPSGSSGGSSAMTGSPGSSWADDGGTPPWDGNPVDKPCNLDTSSAAKVLYAMDPTKGLASGGYPGDNRCIDTPDPSVGMSFHYGPKTYDDPNELTKYVITPGSEITDCTLFPSANAQTIYFREYHSRMRPGSHHMLLFLTPLQSGQAPTTSDGPVDCNMMATRSAAQQRNLFGAQQAVWDGDMTAFTSPENQGVAVMLAPQQQVSMQAHFINATSSPMLREVWANIKFFPKDQITELADPIFFISGFTMNVPMGQSQQVTGSSVVPSNAASDFRLLLATGHYHAHTSRFIAWKTVNGQKDLLFEEFGQSTFQQPYTEIPPEPGNWSFVSNVTNPTADEANHLPGAYSGALYMKPGDTITWECDITNNDVSTDSPYPYNANSIVFANAVYSGEMCNMFGIYAPSFAPDTGCSWKGGQVTLLTGGSAGPASCP